MLLFNKKKGSSFYTQREISIFCVVPPFFRSQKSFLSPFYPSLLSSPCFMYKLFLIFYLFYCSLVYGSSDDDDITQYSTDDAPQSQNVIHSKNIFTNPPIVTDITSFVRIKVYCEIDSRFCNKVNHAFISAATQLSEVVLLKNRIT